jgi:hypothetical protein
MTPVAAAASRARSDAIIERLVRLDAGERRVVLRGLTDAQRAELATRRFGFEEEGQPSRIPRREDSAA